MRSLAVFCGSSSGSRPEYAVAAAALGQAMAARKVRLVYGGGGVGLMGVVADAVLGGGGDVVGVLPVHLAGREVAHDGLADLRVVATMHERKALMAELADGFVALPGGLGTLEELFEVLTWKQLGLHDKPVGLLDVAGYYDGLASFLDVSVVEGFVGAKNRAAIVSDTDAGRLVDMVLERVESLG